LVKNVCFDLEKPEVTGFCKRVSLKLWQPSKQKLNNASAMQTSLSKPKPTLIK